MGRHQPNHRSRAGVSLDILVLHCISLHRIALHTTCVELPCIAFQIFHALYFTVLHYIAWHCTGLHCTSVFYHLIVYWTPNLAIIYLFFFPPEEITVLESELGYVFIQHYYCFVSYQTAWVKRTHHVDLLSGQTVHKATLSMIYFDIERKHSSSILKRGLAILGRLYGDFSGRTDNTGYKREHKNTPRLFMEQFRSCLDVPDMLGYSCRWDIKTGTQVTKDPNFDLNFPLFPFIIPHPQRFILLCLYSDVTSQTSRHHSSDDDVTILIWRILHEWWVELTRTRIIRIKEGSTQRSFMVLTLVMLGSYNI